MPSDFSRLSQFSIDADRRATYRMSEVDLGAGDVTIEVAPATDANASYFNALVKQSKEGARALRQAGATAAALDAQRALAVALYSRHVLRGWSGVVDASGKVVAFSPEEAEGFLRALPGWIFDRLRAFCSEPSNFVQPGTSTPSEVAASSGN